MTKEYRALLDKFNLYVLDNFEYNGNTYIVLEDGLYKANSLTEYEPDYELVHKMLTGKITTLNLKEKLQDKIKLCEKQSKILEDKFYRGYFVGRKEVYEEWLESLVGVKQ